MGLRYTYQISFLIFYSNYMYRTMNCGKVLPLLVVLFFAIGMWWREGWTWTLIFKVSSAMLSATATAGQQHMTTTTGKWAAVLIPHKCKLLLLFWPSTSTNHPHQACHEWQDEENNLFVLLPYVQWQWGTTTTGGMGCCAIPKDIVCFPLD